MNTYSFDDVRVLEVHKAVLLGVDVDDRHLQVLQLLLYRQVRQRSLAQPNLVLVRQLEPKILDVLVVGGGGEHGAHHGLREVVLLVAAPPLVHADRRGQLREDLVFLLVLLRLHEVLVVYKIREAATCGVDDVLEEVVSELRVLVRTLLVRVYHHVQRLPQHLVNVRECIEQQDRPEIVIGVVDQQREVQSDIAAIAEANHVEGLKQAGDLALLVQVVQ